MAAVRSVLATCDLQKMVSKLGLHRAVNLTDLTAEHHLVKLWHHCAGAERAKVAALGAGRTARVLAGNIGEIRSVGDLLFEVVTFFFAVDEDVAGACLWHSYFLRNS